MNQFLLLKLFLVLTDKTDMFMVHFYGYRGVFKAAAF